MFLSYWEGAPRSLFRNTAHNPAERVVSTHLLPCNTTLLESTIYSIQHAFKLGVACQATVAEDPIVDTKIQNASSADSDAHPRQIARSSGVRVGVRSPPDSRLAAPPSEAG